MLDLKGIRNIIFDLGGVLLDLDFMAAMEKFRKLGADIHPSDFRHALEHPLFLEFEKGEVPAAVFRIRIRELLHGVNLSDREIDEAWCSILGSVPPGKVELLKKLAMHYRLFLFSNTNAIHIEHFCNLFEKEYRFPFESLFEKSFYSHILQARKPEEAAFEKVIALAGVLPGETLFVDDFRPNVDGGARLGLRGYHYIAGTDLCQVFGYYSQVQCYGKVNK